MKTKIVLAAALMLLLACPPLVHAVTTCQTGTLTSYIALGAEGCIFDGAIYNNFSFPAISTNGITPDDILVTPNLLPAANLFQGLNFTPLLTTGWSVGAGLSEEFVINYDVASIAPAGLGTGVLTLDLGAAQISGPIGSVIVKETIAPATTASIPLEVFEICEEVCSLKQSDSVTVTPIQPVQTTLTVTLDGGDGGVSLSGFAALDAFGPQPG